MGHLEADDPHRRQGACMRLGMMGSQASGAYGKILDHYRNDPSASVRADCLEALGKIGGRENTARTLINELDNSSKEMKLHAVRGLGELGSPQAVEPLGELLDHDEPELRKAVARSLQKIKDPDALPALRNQLKYESNKDVRDELETAIYLIESEQS